MARISGIILVVLAVCLLSVPTYAKRPGRPGRRIRPTPEELAPLPPNVVDSPLPERHAVDPVPIEALIPAVTEPIVEPDQRDVITGEPIAAAACGTYVQTDIRPLRKQWNSGNGYCGEMSLQLIAMTRGIYISQKTSRRLGVAPGADHPDLLFDARIQPANAMSGVYGVSKMLGLYQPPESYWYTDNMTRTATKTLNPSPSVFATWIKRNVIAGWPVIGGFRVSGGGYEDYDHIMPVYGVCHNSANGLSNGDVFVLTDNYMSELKHTPADKNFYAKFGGCGYTGCIPNDYWDMGVAVGPLNVPANLYFPVRLTIRGWSDGSSVSGEPGEGRTTAATAAYTATVSGLTAGQNYRLYRTTGLFSMFTIPPSAAALAATCTSQGPGCLAISFTATGPTMAFTEGSTGSAPGAGPLGVFAATGVTYFLAVRA